MVRPLQALQGDRPLIGKDRGGSDQALQHEGRLADSGKAGDMTLVIRYGGCLQGYEERKAFGSKRELERYVMTQDAAPRAGGGRHILCRGDDKNVLFYVPQGPTPKLLGSLVIEED